MLSQSCAQGYQRSLQKEASTVFSIFPAFPPTLGRRDLGVYVPGMVWSATLWSRLGLSDTSPQPTHPPTQRVLRREAIPSSCLQRSLCRRWWSGRWGASWLYNPFHFHFLCRRQLLGMTKVLKSLKQSSRRCPWLTSLSGNQSLVFLKLSSLTSSCLTEIANQNALPIPAQEGTTGPIQATGFSSDFFFF